MWGEMKEGRKLLAIRRREGVKATFSVGRNEGRKEVPSYKKEGRSEGYI